MGKTYCVSMSISYIPTITMLLGIVGASSVMLGTIVGRFDKKRKKSRCKTVAILWVVPTLFFVILVGLPISLLINPIIAVPISFLGVPVSLFCYRCFIKTTSLVSRTIIQPT